MVILFINDYFIIHFSTVLQKRIFFSLNRIKRAIGQGTALFYGGRRELIRLVKDDNIKKGGGTNRLLSSRG